GLGRELLDAVLAESCEAGAVRRCDRRLRLALADREEHDILRPPVAGAASSFDAGLHLRETIGEAHHSSSAATRQCAVSVPGKSILPRASTAGRLGKSKCDSSASKTSYSSTRRTQFSRAAPA